MLLFSDIYFCFFHSSNIHVDILSLKQLHLFQTLEQAAMKQFSNHVVVLVLSGKNSPPLGLRQLVS